jgi:hypothetical protein
LPSLSWAELLGLPLLSSAAAFKPSNKHPFHVQPDPKFAGKHPLEYM